MLQFDGQPVDPVVLSRMGTVLRHRGPEGFGVQRLEVGRLHIGLGHTRLKIIDLSDEAGQPMSNEAGTVWATFNGEIYNYRELRMRLLTRGVRFRTTSDTEVLLRLYEAEGERFVGQLEGMFAFAIWDAPRQRLLVARDRVGKKPVFYYATDRLLAFASEIKALGQHPEIHLEVDEEVLPAFFLYGYVPTPGTLYRGVRSLPPGHVLRVEADGRWTIESYWDVALEPVTSRPTSSWDDAKAQVRELLTEAVRCRLIADVPIGAFLSGGLDSSIVVGIMSRLMDQPVRTFSIGFAKDRRYDETAYARLVAKQFQTVHTEFVVEPSSVALVERLVWHHDGPFADSSAIPTYLLAQLTRQHVTVALNGDGGDELFAGYSRFYAALLAERLPRWACRAMHHMLQPLPSWGHSRGLWNRLKRFTDSASRPLAERFTQWAGVFSNDLPCLLPESPGLFSSHGNGRMTPRALALIEPYLSRSASSSILTRLLHLNLKTYLVDDLLVKMDRCSMAHALETRSPFLDRQLIEYVFGLPDAMKLRGLRTKVILREAFADLLPPQVLRRRKMGFGVPLQTWFQDDLRGYLHETLLGPDARLRRYVDQRYVQDLWRRHTMGQADYGHRLWTLLTFEVWLRQLSQWRASPTLSEEPAATAQAEVR